MCLIRSIKSTPDYCDGERRCHHLFSRALPCGLKYELLCNPEMRHGESTCCVVAVILFCDKHHDLEHFLGMNFVLGMRRLCHLIIFRTHDSSNIILVSDSFSAFFRPVTFSLRKPKDPFTVRTSTVVFTTFLSEMRYTNHAVDTPTLANIT